MRALCCLVLALSFAAPLLAQDAIQHRFVATDESGHQILLVDEANPAKGWVVKQHARDLQLVGENRLMVSVNGNGGTAKNGFLELDLVTGKVVRRVEVEGFARVMTARRAANGTTFLGGYGPKGIRIVQVDKAGKPLKTIDCPPVVKNIRLMRRTVTGTVLLGSGKEIFEVDAEGKIVWQKAVPGGNHIYKAVRLANGNIFAASGYGASLAELSPEGKVLGTFGKKEGQKVRHPKFFADFHLLTNGNVVVANWMGHTREDSRKGQQLAEYTPAGDLVWTWHDAKLAGCLHGVIILDGLDTTKLHTETNGPLRPTE